MVQLINDLFGIKPKVRERRKYSTINIEINSKLISKFLISLGFPNGEKKNKLRVPNWIIRNKEYATAFLRGLVDTDGCLFFAKRGTYRLNTYPVIEIKSHDPRFINDLNKIVKSLNFSLYKGKDKIQLNGKKNLKKWLNEIGFKNLNNLSRYLVWKKFKYCPPKTNLVERLRMLSSGGRTGLCR